MRVGLSVTYKVARARTEQISLLPYHWQHFSYLSTTAKTSSARSYLLSIWRDWQADLTVLKTPFLILFQSI